MAIKAYGPAFVQDDIVVCLEVLNTQGERSPGAIEMAWKHLQEAGLMPHLHYYEGKFFVPDGIIAKYFTREEYELWQLMVEHGTLREEIRQHPRAKNMVTANAARIQQIEAIIEQRTGKPVEIDFNEIKHERPRFAEEGRNHDRLCMRLDLARMDYERARDHAMAAAKWLIDDLNRMITDLKNSQTVSSNTWMSNSGHYQLAQALVKLEALGPIMAAAQYLNLKETHLKD